MTLDPASLLDNLLHIGGAILLILGFSALLRRGRRHK